MSHVLLEICDPKREKPMLIFALGRGSGLGGGGGGLWLSLHMRHGIVFVWFYISINATYPFAKSRTKLIKPLFDSTLPLPATE